MDMIQVLLGALLLSVIHALMPDHWIPLVMIGRTEKWSRVETSWVTALTAIPHIISTILVGIAVGTVGYTLSSAYEFAMRIAAPSILVLLGLIYVILDFKGPHQHNHPGLELDASSGRSKFAIVASLGTALFFSPCVAIGSYYFIAGTFGWLSIALVSATYLIVTVLGMILMVNLGLKGVGKVEWRFLERHEKIVTGIVLIVLGISVYFMEM